MKILAAEYILPISDEPLKNGAVVIDNDKIIAVGNKQKITKKFPEAEIEDFSKSVIMPGFVNCHSHLELTIMRGFLDIFDDDFSSWLIKLTKTRRELLSDEDIEISAMLGVLEGIRAGVTCFADIGRWGKAGCNALKQSGLRGILFQETEFSPDTKTADRDFAILLEKFSELRSAETNLVKAGISPHAPYSVSRKLFGQIAAYAKSNEIKLSIHASESTPEENLMQNGVGFFAEIYEKESVNFESPKCSTIQYLSEIGVLETKPLLAHCVQVSEKDIEIIAESGSSIAHCPKSNAKFGHGIAPFEKFLDAKIPIGFGSDSMASNNTCDILEEARFATLAARTRVDKKRFIHAREIIETATIGGAKALGMENEIGTLEAGKQADVIVISLAAAAQIPVHDVYNALLFASNSNNVTLTMVAGVELLRDNILTKVDEIGIKDRIEKIAAKMKQ